MSVFQISVATETGFAGTPFLIWELKQGDPGIQGEEQALDDCQKWKPFLEGLPPVHVAQVERNQVRALLSAGDGGLRNGAEHPSVVVEGTGCGTQAQGLGHFVIVMRSRGLCWVGKLQICTVSSTVQPP